jgi:hypothetical protein
MADPDPLNSEAEAQREETVMPWVWGVFGLVIIAAFVTWAIYGAPQSTLRQPQAATPASRPLDHGY